ncbi:protein-lysine N-methyltransferase SMYD4 [Megachile rotundata]|uniref:protein-lysine N-methyltransferase SMYD4 n=1 Tax=Megachile rotundata TaxID=143995 RepID=UPI000258E0F0|nr:PREDICTED: SET and MYND domain-containing protein 4-like [Megachile rotundata]XP_012139773.1 PREDICTED: SET and MYND domain-containing protein 4-like [Megachile rotundata]
MEEWITLLHSKVIAADKYEDMFREFKSLHTNNERVAYTLKIMLEYNHIPKLCGDVKNAENSTELRNQGNNKFKSKPLTNSLCMDVLQLYTKSIAYAPYPSEELALAYGNRSAILKRLHKYEECIQDIDTALALPFPNNLKYKLYQRKIECLSILNNPKLTNAINEAQYWLEKMTIDNNTRKKMNDMFISAGRVSVSDKSNKQSITKQSSLPELKTHNPEIPCASDAVTLKYNEHYGRHFVAARDIHPGEIIAVEKAYSVMLDPDNLQTHCSNCLKVSWTNIPCNYCTYAIYCSEECKLSDWKKYHDIECCIVPSLLKMNFTRKYLMSLRLAIQAIRESKSIEDIRNELIEVENCNDPRTKGFSKNGTFESNAYRSILSLETNVEKNSVITLFRRSFESSIILYYLAVYTDMFRTPLKDLSQLINNIDVVFIGELILRHLLMIGVNAHSIAEERGINLADRGVAVMAFLSLINHSCCAQILRNSVSNHMVVYAIFPIKKDEQIFDDYGQLFGIKPKAVRQAELLDQYYFKCNCVACLENWPLYHELKLSYNPIQLKVNNAERINYLVKKLKTYHVMAVKGYIFKEHERDELLEIMEIMYESVPMPNAAICEVAEFLKRAYTLSGNRFDIPEL